jgi:hypothetical protein
MSSNTGATSSVHSSRVHRVTDASVESRNSIATTFSTLPSAHAAIIVLTQLFFAVLASGVGLRDAAIVTLATIPIVGGGAAIFAFFTKTNQLSFASLIGGGIAVGTMLPALSSFAIGELGYRGLIDDYALLIGFALLATRTFIGRTPRVAVDPAPVSLLLLAFGVAVFGYYGWGPFVWPFLLGSALAAAIGFVAIRLATTRTSPLQPARAWTYVLLAIPAIGWITQATIDHRLQLPRSYLFTASYTDNLFDEALAFSTSRWGYNENPFFVGHDVVGYLLTNSWAGDLTTALHVSPFSVLSSFGLLITLFGTLYLAYAIAQSVFIDHRAGLVALVLVGLQGSFNEVFPFTEPPRVQQIVTTAWMLLAVVLSEQWLRKSLRLPVLTMLVTVVALVLGKPQIVAFVVLFLGVTFIYAALNKTTRLMALALALLIVIALVVYSLLSDRYFGVRVNEWSVFLDRDTLTTWLVPILLVLLFRTFFVMHNRNVWAASHFFAPRVSLASLTTVIAYALLHDANALRHTVTVALIVGSIAASPFVVRALTMTSRLVTVPIALGGLAFGAAMYFLEQRTIILWLPEGSFSRRISFEHPTMTQAVVVLGVTAVVALGGFATIALFFKSKNRAQSILRIGASAFVAIAVGSNVGVLSAWTARHQLRDVIYVANDKTPPDYGPRDNPKIPVTDWIRNNTDTEAALAGNTLCNYLPETSYLPPGEVSDDCSYRSMASWLTSFSHRRSYIDGPWQAFIWPELGDVANLRYRNSVLFAAEALPSAMEDFERVGVDYFVVDLSQTELRSWEPYATVVYRDDFYLVLQLNY